MKQRHLLLPMAIAAIMFSFSCSKHEDKIKPEKITDAKASTMGISSVSATISYDPNQMLITINSNVAFTPYTIKVTKGGSVIYYTTHENSPYVVVHAQMQTGQSVSVQINGENAGSYTYNGGTPSEDPTWSPSSMTWQLYSDLMKTEVRLTWSFSGSPYVPGPGSKYYLYVKEYCPPRNEDLFTTMIGIPAETGSYTFTRYRWYTTFDYAYLSFMVKGKKIDSQAPVFGDAGSLVNVNNFITSDSHTGTIHYVWSFPYTYF